MEVRSTKIWMLVWRSRSLAKWVAIIALQCTVEGLHARAWEAPMLLTLNTLWTDSRSHLRSFTQWDGETHMPAFKKAEAKKKSFLVLSLPLFGNFWLIGDFLVFTSMITAKENMEFLQWKTINVILLMSRAVFICYIFRCIGLCWFASLVPFLRIKLHQCSPLYVFTSDMFLACGQSERDKNRAASSLALLLGRYNNMKYNSA